MAHGSHMTFNVMMKNVTFLPLLSCAYVYARARVRAISSDEHSRPKSELPYLM